MRHRIGSAVAVLVAAALVAGVVRAEDAPAEGVLPKVQQQVDHPLVKSLLGTWDWTSAGMLTGSGTATWSLGVGGTAVLEDLKGTFKDAGKDHAFVGHGVWKIGADGKTLSVAWLDNYGEKFEINAGELTADGYELKTPDGSSLSFKKTATGFELRMHDGGMTISFKRK